VGGILSATHARSMSVLFINRGLRTGSVPVGAEFSIGLAEPRAVIREFSAGYPVRYASRVDQHIRCTGKAQTSEQASSGKPVEQRVGNDFSQTWVLHQAFYYTFDVEKTIFVFAGFINGRDWPNQFKNFGWHTLKVPLLLLPVAIAAAVRATRRAKTREGN